MKTIFLIVFVFFSFSLLKAQDLIYKKDSTIQRANILEVGIDKIRFRKFEIPNGPIFEILKNDVVKITYSNGYEDILDSSNKKTLKYKLFKTPKNDTMAYSMIYIVFHYGDDNSSIIPIYFNGKYIWTLKNHNRIAYKMYSEGPLTITREYKDNIGPHLNLFIQHCKNYGVYIEIPHPYALEPNKKYSFILLDEAADFQKFLHDDYFGFKPFHSEEKLFKEDKNDPIIKL